MSDYAQVITPEGLALEATQIFGISTTPVLYMAIGKGTTKPTKSDGRKVMESEVYRGLATITHDGKGNISASLSVPAGTVTEETAITEYALFTAASGGVMYARATRAPVTISSTVGGTMTFPVNRSGGSSE
ncbi:MAG: hypothetical protein LUQ71_10200 [Methanoregula sp.]|nr:hypothetical protein [Methanoregula sp.]